MRRLGWLACVLWLCGCGDIGPRTSMIQDAGRRLDDANLQAGCATDSECDKGNQCVTATCDPATHTCVYADVTCTGGACTTPTCDPKSGCGTLPANEGKSCPAGGNAPGLCKVGTCLPIPRCWDATQAVVGHLDCSTTGSVSTNSNDVFGIGVTNNIDTYTCAANETAPEVAYQFVNNGTDDLDITATLTILGASGPDGGAPDGGAADAGATDAAADPADGGAPDAGASGIDLDLIVLEDSCLANAACVNPPLPGGGGFQGISIDAGEESVTFRARAGKRYFLVVDGKSGSSASYRLRITACGRCQPTGTNRLSCNQSMPIAGDTSKGTAVIDSYTCSGGAGPQTLSAAGNEQVFVFTSEAPVAAGVRATVLGAQAPITLAAMPVGANLACAPAQCLAGVMSPETTSPYTASLDFIATPASPTAPSDYWLSVDTQAVRDTTYGLVFECLPYCVKSGALDCTQRNVSGSTAKDPSLVHGWGPPSSPCGGLNGLTGNEHVLLFQKPQTADLPVYRFTLSTLTAGKHLALVVLDAGASMPALCDPTLQCASAQPQLVAASGSGLASTGSYVAAGPSTADGGPSGKTAVVDVTTGTTDAHTYWVIVDGVGGDVSDFTLSIDSGCK